MSGSRYKGEKTTSGTAAAEAAKNNKFKRSNSFVGVGHPNQSSHLDSKETGKHQATDITTCMVGCVCKKCEIADSAVGALTWGGHGGKLGQLVTHKLQGFSNWQPWFLSIISAIGARHPRSQIPNALSAK